MWETVTAGLTTCKATECCSAKAGTDHTETFLPLLLIALVDVMCPTVTPIRYVDIMGVVSNVCRMVSGSIPGCALASAMLERAVRFTGACMEMEKLAL